MCSAPRIRPAEHFRHDPGGSQPGAFGKALAERGIDPKKTEVLGQAEIADEHAIASMGDVAKGIITSGNYDYNLDNPMNKEFVKTYDADYSLIQTSSRSAATTAASDRHCADERPAARPTAIR